MLGLAKTILGKVLCWCCSLAPWDGGGSGDSLEGVFAGVGGLQPRGHHPLGAALAAPTASQPFPKINPLALRGKSLTPWVRY